MPKQLDILALEPYYGGVRKQTLELLSRHSRHRWNIYKLPPRRLDRRLNTAAHWFSQQITRQAHLHCDVIFCSDALNLADLLRMTPEIGHKPSIAYFYSNQLASAGAPGHDEIARQAMLSTAMAATEVWFPSYFHIRGFLTAAAAQYDSHPESGGKESVRGLIAKSQLVHPPVELVPPGKDAESIDSERKGRTICFDCREEESVIFQPLLKEISVRKEPVAVHVLGKPLHNIPAGVPVVLVDGKSDQELTQTLKRCEMYISAKSGDNFDPLAMQAMALGCIPILPREGYYQEFLPKALHAWCLFDGTSGDLLNRLMDLWYLRRPAVTRNELDAIFDRYATITATQAYDRRIDNLYETAAN